MVRRKQFSILTYLARLVVKGRISHMPSLTVVREFVEDSYYHVFNRGVEKRDIFLDDQDYTVFLGLLKQYLTGEASSASNNRHKPIDLSAEVSLLSYCLMPNHFHLLLYQASESGVTKLLRRVSVGYAMYFNNRYDRVGGLYQGRYKAKLVNKDEYLHHVSRYIHLNPGEKYKTWPYSSYKNYTGEKNSSWLKTHDLLKVFDGNGKDYLDYTNDYFASERELQILRLQLANNPDEE